MTPKENADLLLDYARSQGITSTKEIANFMGQMQVESKNFTSLEEELHYSGKRLLEVFPGRNGIDSVAKADEVAKGGPENIANTMYGGDWGKNNLGNTELGDGWRYRGRGYIQLTGRDVYKTIGDELGIDLINNPDLVANPDIAAKVAVQYWKDRVVSRGHQEDVDKTTYDINKAGKALHERRAAADAWETKLERGYVPGTPELEPARTLHQGMQGNDVKHVQEELAQLGYTDAKGQAIYADGSYGPATRYAVESLQRDRGLDIDGRAGVSTQGAIDAAVRESHRATTMLSPSLAGFDDPAHPQHTVYAKLKEVLPPGTSEARLAQFTSACHLAGMNSPEDISAIHIGQSDVVFMPRSLIGVPASINLLEPAPTVQQSMQQMQVYDQQCALSLAQFQAQQQQINAQVQSGPVLGGPPMQ